MSRRIALAVVALATVAVFATGAVGFTNVSAERGVSVAVVDDERAYLGLTGERITCRTIPGEGEQPAETCSNVPLLEVTNQFPSEMTVTDVSISRAGAVAAGDLEGTDLDVGETGTLRGDVTDACSPSAGSSDRVSLAITVSVETESAAATRFDKTVSVTCKRPAKGPDDGGENGGGSVVFDGCGGVDSELGVDTRVYHRRDDGPDSGYNTDGTGQLVGVVTDEGNAFANGNAFAENENGELVLRNDCGDQSERRGEGIDVTGDPPWPADLVVDSGGAGEAEGTDGTAEVED